MATRRAEPIIEIAERPPQGPLRRVIDILRALFGKVVSIVDVCLLLVVAGHTVTDAAGGAGTALPTTRTKIDFADAGIDSVRVVVHGQNSGAGSVTVQVYDVTHSVALAQVMVTGAAAVTVDGDWTRLEAMGDDSVIEVRVIGNGADDPVLYAVHFQARTTQARA